MSFGVNVLYYFILCFYFDCTLLPACIQRDDPVTRVEDGDADQLLSVQVE